MTAYRPAPSTGLATLLVALSALTGCLSEPYVGSDVVLELGTPTPGDIVNRSAEHYELFAVIHEGVVSLGKFRIEPDLTAVDYFNGEPLGHASSLTAGGAVRGIFWRSEVDLEDTSKILLSVEPNGETDLAPSEVIGRASMGPGGRRTVTGNLEGTLQTLGGEAALNESRVTLVY